MKHFALIGLGLVALVAMPLSGCGGLVTNLTVSTPTQVTTLDEAEQATTLVARAADTIVTNSQVSQADLKTALALSDAVGAALTPLENAAASGQSLDFTAINAALCSFQTFQAKLANSGAVTSCAAAVTPTASASASN